MLPNAPFDAALSLYAGRSIIMLKLLPAITGVAAEADDDTLTKVNHGLTVGRAVLYVGGTGFTGLVAGTTYFVQAAPTADTFKLSATKGGAVIDITVDGTVGIFQPVSIFESRKLGHKDNREFKSLPRPDAAGINRTVRKVCVAGSEEFTYEVDEAKRLVSEIFQGALSGIRLGTATIWEPDPEDASGKVALKSDTDFPCDITREGDLNFGDSDFTKAMLKISSRKLGDVLWAVDGDV